MTTYARDPQGEANDPFISSTFETMTFEHSQGFWAVPGREMAKDLLCFTRFGQVLGGELVNFPLGPDAMLCAGERSAQA